MILIPMVIFSRTKALQLRSEVNRRKTWQLYRSVNAAQFYKNTKKFIVLKRCLYAPQKFPWGIASACSNSSSYLDWAIHRNLIGMCKQKGLERSQYTFWFDDSNDKLVLFPICITLQWNRINAGNHKEGLQAISLTAASQPLLSTGPHGTCQDHTLPHIKTQKEILHVSFPTLRRGDTLLQTYENIYFSY